MARKDDELLQTGHRPAPGRNHERGTPRIIWAALLIAMIGAFLIFRSPGGSPSGIGENRSVITVPADDLDTLLTELGMTDSLIEAETPPSQPRSGSVEIRDIASPLTPEDPVAAQESRIPSTSSPAEARSHEPVHAPVSKTTSSKPRPKPKPRVEIRPLDAGPYLVQTGSFGDPQNADREAARLQKLGWDARIKVSSSADGSMVYRVRIGFFADRTAANRFIRNYSKRLPGAIAVHR